MAQKVHANAAVDRQYGRSIRNHRWGYHGSALSNFCPVEYWYLNKAINTLPTDPVKAEKRVVMLRDWVQRRRFNDHTYALLDLGTMIHDQVRFDLGLLGWLRGKWECGYCRATVTLADETMPRVTVLAPNGTDTTFFPAMCPRCAGRNVQHGCYPAWRYVEAKIRKGHLTSSADGKIVHDKFPDELGLLEVKSINLKGWEEQFEAIPKLDHRKQNVLYLWGTPWASFTLFVYYNKNTSDWKAYLYRPGEDPELLDPLLKKMDVSEDHKESPTPPGPEHRVCTHITNARAAGCAFAEACFNRKRPESES